MFINGRECHSFEIKARVVTTALPRPGLHLGDEIALLVLATARRRALGLRNLDVARPRDERGAHVLRRRDGLVAAAPRPQRRREGRVGKRAHGRAVVRREHALRHHVFVHVEGEGEALGGLAGVEQRRGRVGECPYRSPRVLRR